MSAATPHLGKFARALRRSPTGPDTARPHPQTVKPKPQKIDPPNRQTLAPATTSMAQRSARPQRAHATALPAALKSP